MKPIAKAILRRLAYRLGYQNIEHLELLMYSRLAHVDEFFILQVGANDGTTYDPIHDFIVGNHRRVRALLLEPLPDLHRELAQTYAAYSSVQTLPLAIHNTEPSMVLHRVDPAKVTELPSFTKGIASFDPDHHRRSMTPSDAIVEERVRCISMRDLIDSQGIRRIDLLCLDTEGYDAEILRTLDFDRVKPALIMFEHGIEHGVMNRETLAEVLALLHRNGYDLTVQKYDVIAHQRGRLAIR